MPRVEDNSEGFYAAGRIPGRFQVSARFASEDPDPRHQRFAYEVFDADDEVIFSSESGWECTLIETPTRQQLKAVFFEDSRGVTHLAFQRFLRDGRPMKDKKTLHLSQREVQVLKDFLSKIEVVELVGDSGVRFTAEAAQQLLEGQSLPLSLLTERRDEIIEFLRSEVSAPEVTALARRRDKLAEFREMLDQDLDEPTWQAWLESEPWILGFGAAPQFLHRIGDSLETVVKGFDPVAGGSRSDGLLRTAGRLSSLVFVEIKRPDADLLQEKAYRSDAWLPGRDVVGGVAQVGVPWGGVSSETVPRWGGPSRDPW